MKNYISGIWADETFMELDFLERHFVITTLIIPEADKPYTIPRSKLSFYMSVILSHAHSLCVKMAERFPDRYEYDGEYLNVKTDNFLGFMNKITFDE